MTAPVPPLAVRQRGAGEVRTAGGRRGQHNAIAGRLGGGVDVVGRLAGPIQSKLISHEKPVTMITAFWGRKVVTGFS